MPPRRRHRRPALSRADVQRPLLARSVTSPPTRLVGERDAVGLAETLLDPERARPVVVVSVPAGRGTPWIDATAVAQAVIGLAEVVVLETGSASWRLAALLPPGGEVYGGAGRAYPPGAEWMTDLSLAPLRFAYGEKDAARATEELVHDVLRMVAGSRELGAAGWSEEVTGRVKGLVPPSRALVELEDGGLASVWQELVAADVPIDRLVGEGQEVRGVWDAGSKRLDITGMKVHGSHWWQSLERGDVVLTQVVEVRPDVVRLTPHPDLVVAVAKDRVTTNPLDSLTSLFTVGEVVPARVAARDGDSFLLRLDDIDDDEEPLPAPALLEGGPAWLVLPSDETVADDVRPSGAEDPEPGPGEDGARSPDEDGAAQAPARRPAPRAPRPAHVVPAPVGTAARRASRRDAATGEAFARRARDLERECELLREQLADAERRATAFMARSRELEARNSWLESKMSNQKTALRREKLRAQRAAEGTPSRVAPETVPRLPAFQDPVRQFEHEVYLEWATRISAAEKVRYPLAPWTVGPDFVASLEEIQGVDRAKVVRVVVEVLTGLAESLDGRELHALREGPSGGAPPLVRTTDGAAAWRVALQRGTPAARRLHFWRNGNDVELSRVVTHDDMRP